MKLGLAIAGGVFCSTLPTTAHAANHVLNVTAQPGQEARWEDGRRAISSIQPHSSLIFIAPSPALAKRGAFKLVVTDTGDQSEDVGPRIVSAELADGTPVSIKSFAELTQEEGHRERRARFAAAMGALGRSMQASNAGEVYGSTNYQSSTAGMAGATPFQANTMGTGTFTVYDPARAAAAEAATNEENREAAADFAMQAAARRGELQQNLKMTTIDPGQGVGGFVQFDLPDEVRHSKSPVGVTFTIQVGQDQHQIVGEFAPAK